MPLSFSKRPSNIFDGFFLAVYDVNLMCYRTTLIRSSRLDKNWSKISLILAAVRTRSVIQQLLLKKFLTILKIYITDRLISLLVIYNKVFEYFYMSVILFHRLIKWVCNLLKI